jgi:hypothetical protein
LVNVPTLGLLLSVNPISLVSQLGAVLVKFRVGKA